MLQPNDILDYAAPQARRLRILWTNPAQDLAYTYQLDAVRASPEAASLSELLNDVVNQRASRVLPDPHAAAPDLRLLPAKHLMLRDRAYELVSALLAHAPEIYQPRARGQLVARLAEVHGVSHPSAYRYLRRFWERGQTRDALLPDYGNSGAPGETRRANANIKRGRPRKAGEHPGLNADVAVRGTFQTAVARYAATHTAFSRRGAYRQMIQDFYQARAAEALPSFGQFNYWIEKDACLAPRVR